MVRDGQQVEAGQVLIELDPTQARADAEKSREGYWAASLEAARHTALLEGLRGKDHADLIPTEGAPSAMANAERQLLRSQLAEHHSKLASVDAEAQRRRAELDSARQLVAKLAETLPLATQRAQDLDKLRVKFYVSQHEYLDKEQARIEMTRDLAYQRGRVRELQAAIQEGEQRRRALIAEAERVSHEALTDAMKRAEQLQQDHVKASQRHSLTRLVAPTTGTVQQLAIHTEGGVVQAAQPLMQVVPTEDSTEIEAVLENKDVGFVRVG